MSLVVQTILSVIRALLPLAEKKAAETPNLWDDKIVAVLKMLVNGEHEKIINACEANGMKLSQLPQSDV